MEIVLAGTAFSHFISKRLTQGKLVTISRALLALSFQYFPHYRVYDDVIMMIYSIIGLCLIMICCHCGYKISTEQVVQDFFVCYVASIYMTFTPITVVVYWVCCLSIQAEITIISAYRSLALSIASTAIIPVEIESTGISISIFRYSMLLLFYSVLV